MANILFITHRFPYPPDRGEKIRGWNLIRHLAKSHRVFLGCLVDNPGDWQYGPNLDPFCAELGAFPISKPWQKIKSFLRCRPGQPLMLEYYRNRDLVQWVQGVMGRERIDIAYIFSTAMAPYALDASGIRKLLDMQDIDSEKWMSYAQRSRWPARLLWAREARTLLAYERYAASRCEYTTLVTEAEARRLEELAPELRGRVGWLEQGVDLETFAPNLGLANPYPTAGPWLSFTGNMDYWPNVDAAIWFAHEVLPLVQAKNRDISFAVVGANPGPDVKRLARLSGVLVTGRVADVRPYIASAAVSVAPLRMARGVQNKVLEAMALGRPVVATTPAFEGIRAKPGRDLLVADEPAQIAAAIWAILANEYPKLPAAARQCVEESYAWAGVLEQLDSILAGRRSAEPTDSTTIGEMNGAGRPAGVV